MNNDIVGLPPASSISRHLNGALQLKYPDRHHYRDRVVLELLMSAFSSQLSPAHQQSFPWQEKDQIAEALAEDFQLWCGVDGVVAATDTAITRYPDDGKMLERWDIPLLSALNNPLGSLPVANMEQLGEAARLYAINKWAASPSLELWLARQLIFAETLSLGQEMGLPVTMKTGKFWWIWTKATVKWLIGLAAAVTLADSHGWAVGVLAYAIWLSLIRYLASDQISRLTTLDKVYVAMRLAYTIAIRPNACPVELEKALTRAEDLGSVWPSGLRSVLERAMLRDRASWS